MFYKKSDILIILIIILIGLATFFIYNYIFAKTPAKAEIYYNSKLVKTLDLDIGVDKTFSIEQNSNVIFHLFSDGSICFEESNCPDKICINSGRLRIVGQSTACLPNKIVLKIVGKGNEEEFDIYVGN